DRDRDGKILLSEADVFIHREMKYREDQLTRGARTASWEADFVLRDVDPGRAVREVEGPYQIGDFIEAKDFQGNWYVSQVLDRKPRSYRVHFCGWEDRWDEWVDTSRMRRVSRPKLAVGERYEVEWQPNQWYLATVTRAAEDYFYFVHYAGE